MTDRHAPLYPATLSVGPSTRVQRLEGTLMAGHKRDQVTTGAHRPWETGGFVCDALCLVLGCGFGVGVPGPPLPQATTDLLPSPRFCPFQDVGCLESDPRSRVGWFLSLRNELVRFLPGVFTALLGLRV